MTTPQASKAGTLVLGVVIGVMGTAGLGACMLLRGCRQAATEAAEWRDGREPTAQKVNAALSEFRAMRAMARVSPGREADAKKYGDEVEAGLTEAARRLSLGLTLENVAVARDQLRGLGTDSEFYRYDLWTGTGLYPEDATKRAECKARAERFVDMMEDLDYGLKREQNRPDLPAK
jgi:hypothetical protein